MRVGIKRMSLKKLQSLIQERGPEFYPQVIDALDGDPRGGAQRLVQLCRTQLASWQREQDRMVRMLQYERQLWAMGYQQVAGVDEAGRGPLAGPVVAAAVILPRSVSCAGIDDFKRLSSRRRYALYQTIREMAVAIGIGIVDPAGIDEASVLAATYAAMAMAVADLSVSPEFLLVDALSIPGVAKPQSHLANGETTSCSVAAAAAVAKVTRDEYMVNLDRLYPQYGFARHKGYGTAEHRAALEQFGPCPAHRVGGLTLSQPRHLPGAAED